MAISAMGLCRILPMTSKTNVRYITSSSILLGRRNVLRSVRAMQLPQEEVEGMSPDDMDALADTDITTLKANISQLDHDAAKHQSHIRIKTVEKKYFQEYKENEENLLTWAMKEQLRYLHSTDPHAWTPEVLAKAFPITPTGVQKLLKSKWVPRNEAAIERHDKAVAARWKKHAKGQLGSARLIDKALLSKYSKETAPVPTLSTDELLASVQNLKFENEEKIRKPKGLKPKNKLPDTSKYKIHFSKIITDYEDQLSKSKERENSGDKSQPSTTPLPPHALPTGPPQYQGTYSKISVPHIKERQYKSNSKSKKMKNMMTFSEFLKHKSET